MDLIDNSFPSNPDNKQSVLVVEDNDELRQFLVTLLLEDYLVYSANNGKTGIELAINHLPDVIISDIIMPINDGFELVSQLSQHENTSHIPIILITAKIDQESQLKGLSLGAVDYITKPFEINNISLKLKNILRRQKELLASHLSQDTHGKNKFTDNEADRLFLHKLDHILMHNYQDSGFSVAKLISELSMTERQLQRKFKKLLHEKPATYIRKYRLQKAKELLLKGQAIKVISDNVGFNSQTYFSQSFKLAYGQSPKDFAHSLLKN